MYKQAVNLTQAIRKDLKGLPREQQQSFTQTVADTYRRLADLLLKRNRVLEAQQVLDLLKIQELDDYFRNVRGKEQTDQDIKLLPQERQVRDNFAAIQEQAVQFGKELSQLRQISPNNRTLDQTQRIAELEQIQQQLQQRFNEFIRRSEVVTATQRLEQTTGSQSLDLPHLSRLQRQLRQLEGSPVLLYPLVLEDRLELVLVTPYSPPIHRTVPVKREDLNRTIVEFRRSLVEPTTRSNLKAVQKPARQLYDWLIQPIKNELDQADSKTIIYAPDGQLRYIQTWNLTNVDLVVLSACQTGIGGILGNGEEILGLGYQMQQAGALATIASLWVVDDEGTHVLMDAFYGALRQGNTKTEALQKAQTTLINSPLLSLSEN